MLEHAFLYFVPSKGEFLKTQPGTGDNLLREDIAEGYTDYILWSTFKPVDLGIDGELEMECLDSGMLLLKEGDSTSISDFLYQAYGEIDIGAILLMSE